jgi:hypothetical protein
MAGFMSNRTLVVGDRVLILAGEYASEIGTVADIEPPSMGGNSEPRYRLRRPGPPFTSLGTFDAALLRGLVGLTGPLASRIGRVMSLSDPLSATLGELLERAEALLPPAWDLEVSRIGTNEGQFRYRAYAADPTGADDLVVYGSTLAGAARELLVALEQRFGNKS